MSSVCVFGTIVFLDIPYCCGVSFIWTISSWRETGNLFRGRRLNALQQTRNWFLDLYSPSRGPLQQYGDGESFLVIVLLFVSSIKTRQRLLASSPAREETFLHVFPLWKLATISIRFSWNLSTSSSMTSQNQLICWVETHLLPPTSPLSLPLPLIET